MIVGVERNAKCLQFLIEKGLFLVGEKYCKHIMIMILLVAYSEFKRFFVFFTFFSFFTHKKNSSSIKSFFWDESQGQWIEYKMQS